MWITSSTATALTPTAIALGNFDGLHLGHQQVILPIAPRCGQGHPTVVTFFPHPREFFTGQTRSLLTPRAEKALHLQAMGVEQLVILPFTQKLAALSPQQFVAQILVNQLQVKQVSVGEDFQFGHHRSGKATDLRTLAASYGIAVNIVPLLMLEHQRVSSSLIRSALLKGDLRAANQMLGYSYCLLGQVESGRQLGRTIGFPTANLQVPADKLIPQTGVYAVRVSDASELSRVPGVMNIGYRPTVNPTANRPDNSLEQTIEVHLLDWTGDLYGRHLRVEMESLIRSEQKFASLEALKAQISADCQVAKTVLRA